MQRDCTAARGAAAEGVTLEAPVLLGDKLENAGFGVFSKMRTIFFGWQLPACRKR
jgi:hypothetical protein